MTEHPILFTPENAWKVFTGDKTMTRRIVKPQPDTIVDGEPYWSVGGFRLRASATNPLRCPYGTVGDRLWVRETHYRHGRWVKREEGKRGRYFQGNAHLPMFPEEMAECAEEGSTRKQEQQQDRWWKRSALFMPRWASRTTVEITAICMQPLHRITQLESLHEGCEGPDYTANFFRLWESIHGPASRPKNEWVWCLSFRRIDDASQSL